MPCQCNTPAKALTVVSVLTIVIGAIISIVAQVNASGAADIEFVAGPGKTLSFQLEDTGELEAGSGGCGMSIYVRVNDPCSAEDFYVTDPSGDVRDLSGNWGGSCSKLENSDPPLQRIGSVHINSNYENTTFRDEEGLYTVTGPVDMWAVDGCKELGEAVGGVFAAGVTWLIAIAIIIGGLICACVACCCACGCCGNQGKAQA